MGDNSKFLWSSQKSRTLILSLWLWRFTVERSQGPPQLEINKNLKVSKRSNLSWEINFWNWLAKYFFQHSKGLAQARFMRFIWRKFLIFLSFCFWYFAHFSCMIFFPFFPFCPSYLDKCKQRLRDIFITWLPKVTKNEKWKMRWTKH